MFPVRSIPGAALQGFSTPVHQPGLGSDLHVAGAAPGWCRGMALMLSLRAQVCSGSALSPVLQPSLAHSQHQNVLQAVTESSVNKTKPPESFRTQTLTEQEPNVPAKSHQRWGAFPLAQAALLRTCTHPPMAPALQPSRSPGLGARQCQGEFLGTVWLHNLECHRPRLLRPGQGGHKGEVEQSELRGTQSTWKIHWHC